MAAKGSPKLSMYFSTGRVHSSRRRGRNTSNRFFARLITMAPVGGTVKISPWFTKKATGPRAQTRRLIAEGRIVQKPKRAKREERTTP